MRIAIITLLTLCAGACLAQDEPETVDIRYMLRGYFYAGTAIEDEQALGGFGSSDNLPVEAPRELLSEGRITLVVQLDEDVRFAGKYRGLRVLLLNGKDEVVPFAASDSRLSIVQEARAEDGTWKPIEYLPSSWCGNSYHRVFLAPGQCWRFVAPRCEGEVEPELRFRLEHEDGAIVSESFRGSINPEQFEVQRPYNPQGLMDPYSD